MASIGGLSLASNASISVTPASSRTLTTGSLLPATLQNSYSVAFGAIAGYGSYSFKVTSGTLPAGLILTGGILRGTPTYSFTIAATDVNNHGLTGSTKYTVTVNPAISVTQATLNVATSAKASASN